MFKHCLSEEQVQSPTVEQIDALTAIPAKTVKFGYFLQDKKALLIVQVVDSVSVY